MERAVQALRHYARTVGTYTRDLPRNDALHSCGIEEAFARALDQAIQARAEAAFTKAFENGAPFGQKLQEKMEEGLQRFIQEGIQWDKKKPGFKK